ncbi:cysteine proteinase [Serendipita vermifera]|nr:cysteine proteinase [Serendipita vermifera]
MDGPAEPPRLGQPTESGSVQGNPIDPSVNDHQLFMQTHLPDLGPEVEDTQIFTWKITSWSSLPNRTNSTDFLCGGHKWNVLLFPKGNTKVLSESVSIYVEHASHQRSNDWHVCAQFGYVLSNPNDPHRYVVSHAYNRFTPEEPDWGFTGFYSLRKLLHSDKPNLRPIIENNAATITIFARVFKDPTGVLWHNFINYDSKKMTGYVGLQNQGATAYMNILLQSLYCIPYFRKSIYKIPTENAVVNQSVALALQRIFYNLQTSDQKVTTTELTKSFGWKALDSFMAHDVYEFAAILLDKIEGIIKGTPADGSIEYLFWGKMRSYIRCVNINFESSRLEDYNFLELNVTGFRNLRESFRDYVCIEMLDGELKYHVQGHVPQVAKKGVELVSLPTVLRVRLKRYVYDVQRGALAKCGDRFEYPSEIDMEEFLSSDANRSESHVYQLHTVMVHSGDLTGGHYYTFIKPNDQTPWLKFDDDRVTPATDKEVFENNYGTGSSGLPLRPGQKSTDAYVLTYIRKSRIAEVLRPLTDTDVPLHLKMRSEEEKRQAEEKRKETEEQKLYVTIKVITEESFRQHEGFDLGTFDDKNSSPSELLSFRVLKQDSYYKFKTQVAQRTGLPTERIRLWVISSRQNKTLRPDIPIPDTDLANTVETVRNTMAPGSAELHLFLDVLPEGQKVHPPLDGNMIMLFLKYFDPSKQTLHGVGRIHVSRRTRIGDLSRVIYEKMGWPNTKLTQIPLIFFEEIKPTMVEQVKSNSATLAQSELQDGDVLCFQVQLDQQEVADLEVKGLASSAVKFYDILLNRIMIHFKAKNGAAQETPDFDLSLSKKMTYEMMVQEVGKHLKCDYQELRLTTRTSNGQPDLVLGSPPNQVLSEMFHRAYGVDYGKPTVLYELVPEPMSGPI